ncbi:MAG: outer membrane beta-barrel protein [Candidatus Eisenbacteria bacterium]|nr:outer membrane beta-barrel protein [Candidatus Eisenbacteria bacterium]
MRTALLIALVGLLVVSSPSGTSAGVVDVGVGLSAGAALPLEDDAGTGAIIGLRLRLTPGVPVIAGEVSYSRVFQDDLETAWSSGDIGLSVDDGAFGVASVDVLLGNVGGVGGLKWYGILGANAVDYELGDDESEIRWGGEFGAGVEFAVPALGVSIEGRGTVMILAWEESTDRRLSTLTGGVWYTF